MNTGSTADNLITPKELSRLLNISMASIYRLIGKRVFPFYKIGGSLRFSKPEIEKYLDDIRIDPMAKQYEHTQARKKILD
ncbi:MAG: helix-turn-helix domain-containing protein [Candidatus Parcubacteria bacterium]|nr:helix-turn-helix domain-containing protein [Candidatus Parcubacteria bacterium]